MRVDLRWQSLPPDSPVSQARSLSHGRDRASYTRPVTHYLSSAHRALPPPLRTATSTAACRDRHPILCASLLRPSGML